MLKTIQGTKIRKAVADAPVSQALLSMLSSASDLRQAQIWTTPHKFNTSKIAMLISRILSSGVNLSDHCTKGRSLSLDVSF